MTYFVDNPGVDTKIYTENYSNSNHEYRPKKSNFVDKLNENDITHFYMKNNTNNDQISLAQPHDSISNRDEKFMKFSDLSLSIKKLCADYGIKIPTHTANMAVSVICGEVYPYKKEGGNRKKKARPLPSLPEGKHWPSEVYSGSQESKKNGGGICKYLTRVWGDIHQLGIPLALRTIRTIDPSAAKAIDRFRDIEKNIVNSSKKRRNQQTLPFDIPIEKEITDRRIVDKYNSVASAVASDPQLATTILSRLRRGVSVPGLV